MFQKKILKFICITALFNLFSQIAFCVDWSISSVPFTGDATSIDRKNTVVKTTSLSVNELLPKLILNELQINGNRLVTSDESITRFLYALDLDRQILFEELTKQISSRDGILFSATNKSDFKSKLNTADKQIAETRKKLEKNIEYSQMPLETLAKVLKDKNKLAFTFEASSFTATTAKAIQATDKVNEDKWSIRPGELLPVSIWKNDNTILFEKQKEDETKIAFENRILAENLSCLLSGSFFVRDQFVYVKIRVDFFPRKHGEKERFIEISDIGSVQNLPGLARSAAYRIIPSIMNIKPIELHFSVTPLAANNNLRVAANGIALQLQDNKAIITPGEHIITISSDGYISEETAYNFIGNDAFKITVELKPTIQIALNVNALKTEGKFYFNSLPQELQNKNGNLPNQTILGEFVSDAGVSTYFISKLDEKTNSGSVSANLKPLNKSIKSQIETSRKVMYISYSALILSLPLLFVAIGTTENIWEREKLATWEKIKWSAIGVSGALGVNFLTQLIIYLIKANKVLPEEIHMKPVTTETELETKQTPQVENPQKLPDAPQSDPLSEEQDNGIQNSASKAEKPAINPNDPTILQEDRNGKN